MFTGSQRRGRALWSASRVSAGVWTKRSTTRLSSLRTSGSWQPNLLFNIHFRCVRQTDLDSRPISTGACLGEVRLLPETDLHWGPHLTCSGKIMPFTYLAVFLKNVKVKGRDWRVLFGWLVSWWSKIYPLSHSKYLTEVYKTLHTFFFITISDVQVP